ncbi:DUF2550 domain-containing protein [Arcanobacterium phocisimile]|uniref:DUF2550 domain-containing protein n=1 Tax=Arcanobacterium phocisimile TaxID=1302235 RepID=A0ABX7II40_9ACTO|nr:DUF2550 family protein [Arcanobacterium phocisimile]QRV02515.1 DUF2550 domain-containing protein [Arcanobacterium phocisimile]
MISWALWWTVVAVALCVILIGVYFLMRLRTLFSRRGSFHVAVREEGSERWVTGVAVFKPFELNWYSTHSLSPYPQIQWKRGELDFTVSPATDSEIQVVRIQQGERSWSLATTPLAVSGIVSWIDSAPPVEEPELF